MTAPVTRFSKEDYDDIIHRIAVVLRDCPCPHDDECQHCKNLTVLIPFLRQAAAEWQGNEEAKRLMVNRARDAVSLLRDSARTGVQIDFRERDPLVVAIHDALDLVVERRQWLITATPTEPTPPPAVGRCKTCQHWDMGHLQVDGPLNGAVYSLCRNDEGGMDGVPADGSGFCHLHEATK